MNLQHPASNAQLALGNVAFRNSMLGVGYWMSDVPFASTAHKRDAHDNRTWRTRTFHSMRIPWHSRSHTPEDGLGQVLSPLNVAGAPFPRRRFDLASEFLLRHSRG